MSATLTSAYIRTWVRTEHGEPTMPCELTNEQINQSIENARRMFDRQMSTYVPHALENISDDYEVQLATGSKGPLYVTFLIPETDQTYVRMSIFELVERRVLPRMAYGEWYQLRSLWDTYMRARAFDPEWVWDQSRNVLLFDCRNGPFDIFYIEARPLTAEAIPGEMEYDFLRTVLAHTNLILARGTRGRFPGGIPGPAGNIAMNAPDLRAEANAVLLEVQENLNGYAEPISPIFG